MDKTRNVSEESGIRLAIRVTVLIPAHNESATIATTLTSLWNQTRKPNRVIVAADNCTDNTSEIAKAHGADVFTTVNNKHKKAGALNQALSWLLPTLTDIDCVLVMDADTIIVPKFIQIAVSTLVLGEYDAIGGVFYGEDGSGLIGALQRNEYIRYSRNIRLRKGKVWVLTGTATLFRSNLLREVAKQRGIKFPGTNGDVYDTLALTEDNEITIAAKTLGAKMISPHEVKTITEIMPTWRQLWKQRMRWERGALENLKAYGITRSTLPYIGQQLGLGYGTFALNLFIIVSIITLIIEKSFVLNPFWVMIGIIFMIERVATVWSGGWKSRLLAFPLVIEIAYDVFQQCVYTKAFWDIIAKKEAQWGSEQRKLQMNIKEEAVIYSQEEKGA